MADSSLIALKAVIAKIKATSSITSIVGTRVYTDPPQNTAFPYIEVDIESSPYAQDDASNMQHTVRVHCFSRKNSPFEVMDINAKVFQTLDRQESSITVESGVLTMCIFAGVKTAFKEPDGKTWHGVIEFYLLNE